MVATPGKLAAALREGFLSPATLQEHLQMLVLDEADLLLSYGYEEDLQLIAPQVRVHVLLVGGRWRWGGGC